MAQSVLCMLALVLRDLLYVKTCQDRRLGIQILLDFTW